jgi:DNA-binding transcriptional regulator LsrR (DeoR family)
MPQSPQQAADSAAQLDRFAELLSLDLKTPEIAERMGIARTRASQLLGKLRAKYGWQAQ